MYIALSWWLLCDQLENLGNIHLWVIPAKSAGSGVFTPPALLATVGQCLRGIKSQALWGLDCGVTSLPNRASQILSLGSWNWETTGYTLSWSLEQGRCELPCWWDGHVHRRWARPGCRGRRKWILRYLKWTLKLLARGKKSLTHFSKTVFRILPAKNMMKVMLWCWKRLSQY